MKVRNEDLKKSNCKTSLVAQWLKKKKNPTANSGDMGSILGLGRSPGEGNGNLLYYSFMKNSTEAPAGLQFMGHKRVRCDWATEHTVAWLCRVSSCYTTKGVGHMYTYMPSLLSSAPMPPPACCFEEKNTCRNRGLNMNYLPHCILSKRNIYFI